MGALLDNKTVELVPHTGVRVFGREVVFSGGIRAQDPTQVVEAMGHGPVRVEAMGETSKTEDELGEFLCSIASWAAESYDLWTKNCNNFSDVVLNFLCGRGVPAWILSLPGRCSRRSANCSGDPRQACRTLNGSLEKNGGLVGPKGETMTLTVKAASGSAAPTSVTLRRRRPSALQRPSRRQAPLQKYQKLKLSNAAFQRKCVGHDGALDVLKEAGFREADAMLQITPSASAWPARPRRARAVSALDAIEAAAAPPPVAAAASQGLAGLGLGGAPPPGGPAA
ncbi:Lys63-specific deubiquitinase [Aureococcus anophagefferens]|nr:Lys63-specific deubiquitinase [Aureococcus anophagefferens]